MGKVICDVCGTAYPETAAQCPICGCAKASTAQTAAADATQRGAEAPGGYTYVKGGRFSKKNVKKRNKASGRMPERRSAPSRQPQKNEEEEKTSVGLIVVVILLLLAIVAVVIYIGVSFFGPDKDNDDSNVKNPGISQTDPSDATDDTKDSTEPSGGDSEQKVPCTDISLSNLTIEFQSAGGTYTLKAVTSPENTTDVVTFVSSDPAVVTVTEDGILTAVGPGEAVITVTCGDVVKECRIICSFGGSDPVDDPTFEFAFNTRYVDEYTGKYDITLSTLGTTWRAYPSDMTYDPAEITWVSDDTAVCTVENGIVTVVGPGTTEIHAQYNGISYSCIVRCPVEKPEEDDTQGEDGTEDTGNTGGSGETDMETSGYSISHDDVTIAVGEPFTLTLKDSEGNVISVDWVADKPDCVTIDGNKITGAVLGTTNVSCTYETTTYTCIVRVK